jgi:GNAT superfamily N-acetyltransferase
MIIRKLKKQEYETFYSEVLNYGLTQRALFCKMPKVQAKKIDSLALKRFFKNGYSTKGNLLYTIENENHYCGHLWLYLSPDEPDVLFLTSLFIQEKYRRLGWGDLIMDFVDKKCLELSRSRIGLNLFFGNKPAVNLYKKHGYFMTEVQMEKHFFRK